jgi:hypothetical protein
MTRNIDSLAHLGLLPCFESVAWMGFHISGDFFNHFYYVLHEIVMQLATGRIRWVFARQHATLLDENVRVACALDEIVHKLQRSQRHNCPTGHATFMVPTAVGCSMAATPTDLAWAILKVDDEPEVPRRFGVEAPHLQEQRLRWLENPAMIDEKLDPGYRAWEQARFIQAASDPEWMERFAGRELEPEESGLLGEEEEVTEEEEVQARQGAGTVRVKHGLDEHGRLTPAETVSHGSLARATEPKLHESTRADNARTRQEKGYSELGRAKRLRMAAEHDSMLDKLPRIDAGMEEEVHAPPPSGFVAVNLPQSAAETSTGGQTVWIPKETYERPHPAFGAKEEEADG